VPKFKNISETKETIQPATEEDVPNLTYNSAKPLFVQNFNTLNFM